MVSGFFWGTTVSSLVRKAVKIEELKVSLREGKEQAIADRQAAIKAAQDDIAQINRL